MTDEEIIDTYSDVVLFLARARTSQPSDADDVYQEVFLKYIRKKPSFKNAEHAKAWFIRVTLNTCNSMYRRPEWQKFDYDSEDMLESVPDDNDFLREIQTRMEFEEQIARINPRYGEVMMLHFDCGYTLKEIGKLLHESENNVKALMARGKKQYIELVLKGDESHAKKMDKHTKK